MGQREGDLRVQEGLGLDAANQLGGDGGNLQDLNGGPASTMAGSHVDVQLLNCTSASGITELLVEVVLTGARCVAKENCEVLDNIGGGLVDLRDVDNLSVSTLQLLQATNKVPEAALGNNLVGGKNPHAQKFGVRLNRRRVLTSDNLVLMDGRSVLRRKVVVSGETKGLS